MTRDQLEEGYNLRSDIDELKSIIREYEDVAEDLEQGERMYMDLSSQIMQHINQAQLAGLIMDAVDKIRLDLEDLEEEFADL